MNLGYMLPEVLRGFYRSWVQNKPDTILYPFTKIVVPERFRGTISYEKEKCIGCKMCMRDCPCEAIEIFKVAEKQFEWKYYLDRCCRCGQCVEVCPAKCLHSTHTYENASGNKEDFIITRPAV